MSFNFLLNRSLPAPGSRRRYDSGLFDHHERLGNDRIERVCDCGRSPPMRTCDPAGTEKEVFGAPREFKLTGGYFDNKRRAST